MSDRDRPKTDVRFCTTAGVTDLSFDNTHLANDLLETMVYEFIERVDLVLHNLVLGKICTG